MKEPVCADPRKVVSKDGTPIAVWRSGEGAPLVLIHGAAADHNRWAPVLPALEERFTVLAVDRRGRGQSGDATDYALEREYEDVVAVVESAGEGVSVLGHSYGGICALEAALLTDGIRNLVERGGQRTERHRHDHRDASCRVGGGEERSPARCGSYRRTGRRTRRYVNVTSRASRRGP